MSKVEAAPLQLPKNLPTPPTFSSVEDERWFRRQRLAAACRVFAHFGFEEGFAGHITARDPEHPGRFWVNPVGLHFAHVKASDLLLVDEAGSVLEGERALNRAAFAIHSRLHRARPDVTAAAHAHSMYGKAWSTTGELLRPLTQDACAFYEDHAVVPYGGVVLSEEEGDRLAASLGDKKALILQNHGLLTVGSSVDEAAWWFIAMERCCQAEAIAGVLPGKPEPLDHDLALATRALNGTSMSGWFSFQPLCDLIVGLQPELLD
ncbi:MAG TPA: class II aldolase/adducin family protein [Acidimicrobiales bacterium]|nr:class II aldolase/adducin family protein [Acidimicrobiales bacterium]